MSNLKLVVCNGYVACTEPCTHKAECITHFFNEELDEPGEYLHCEACFRKLFPRATDDQVEEAKRDLIKYLQRGNYEDSTK